MSLQRLLKIAVLVFRTLCIIFLLFSVLELFTGLINQLPRYFLLAGSFALHSFLFGVLGQITNYIYSKRYSKISPTLYLAATLLGINLFIELGLLNFNLRAMSRVFTLTKDVDILRDFLHDEMVIDLIQNILPTFGGLFSIVIALVFLWLAKLSKDYSKTEEVVNQLRNEMELTV